MRTRFPILALGALLLTTTGAARADNPPASNDNQLVIRSDGYLYLVKDGVRHLVVPISLSDDDINAMPEKEPYLDGLAPMSTTAGSPVPLASVAEAAAPTPTPSISGSAGPVNVTLNEYSIDPSVPVAKPGQVTFNIENHGKARHELIVFRSDLDTAALPTSSNKVTESAVGKKIGEVEFKPGESQTASFNLDAGHYVLLCNLSGHYAKGMVSSIDVK